MKRKTFWLEDEQVVWIEKFTKSLKKKDSNTTESKIAREAFNVYRGGLIQGKTH